MVVITNEESRIMIKKRILTVVLTVFQSLLRSKKRLESDTFSRNDDSLSLTHGGCA